MKKIILLTLLTLTFVYGQSVKVLSVEKINKDTSENYYHPHFSGDDTKIIVTKSNYKGLYAIDLENKNTETITEEFGAGYKPLILPESESIIFKSFIVKNGLKYHSLKSVDILKKKIKTIENERRNLSLPNQLRASKIFYLNNQKVEITNSPVKTLSKTNKENKAVFVKNNSLYLIKNGETTELSPVGKGVYVWASLSKDGSKIIFSFANKGAYVCDIEGNILLNIKDAHYPKFSPDGKYISYMIDKDNGYNYTSSDLFVYSLKENKSYKITDTNDKIEMFADWSHDGKRLVYQTTEGEIYLMKLDIKN